MRRPIAHHARNRADRRGTLLASVVVLLILLQLFAMAIVTAGGRDHDLAARRAETLQAFYAAEAGANMALRELMLNSDEDGDGVVGSISNDGIDGNDPAIGQGRVRVVKVTVASQTTVTSTGRLREARRAISMLLEQ